MTLHGAEQLHWCPVHDAAEAIGEIREHVGERRSLRGWVTRRYHARARLDAAVADVVAAWKPDDADDRDLRAAVLELDDAYRNRHGYRTKRTR